MKNIEKTINLIKSFSFGENVDQFSIELVFKNVENGSTMKHCCHAPTNKREKDLAAWTPERWRQEIVKEIVFYQAINHPIEEIESLVIHFVLGNARRESFTVEATDVASGEFDRIVVEPVDLVMDIGDEPMLVIFPLKEFFLRPDERPFIKNSDAVILASKMVDPARLKEVHNSFPHVMRDKIIDSVLLL